MDRLKYEVNPTKNLSYGFMVKMDAFPPTSSPTSQYPEPKHLETTQDVETNLPRGDIIRRVCFPAGNEIKHYQWRRGDIYPLNPQGSVLPT